MRRVLSVLAVVVVFVGCSGAKNAESYHNELMSVLNGNEGSMSEMNTAMGSRDWAAAENVRKKWLGAVEQQVASVEKMGAFDGDAAFQKTVLDALGGLKKVLVEAYPKLIEIRSKGLDDQASESKALGDINNALEGLATKVNQASATFAAKHSK